MVIKIILAFLFISSTSHAFKKDGNEGRGGMPSAIEVDALTRYVTGEGLKLSMLHYLATLRLNFITDPIDADVKATFEEIMKDNLLVNDIESRKNYVAGLENCLEKSSANSPNVRAWTNTGKNGIPNLGGKICFDIEGLVSDYKAQGLSIELAAVQLAALAFHEHVHHFQNESSSQEVIEAQEKQANGLGGYVLRTAKAGRVPLLKWRPDNSEEESRELTLRYSSNPVFSKDSRYLWYGFQNYKIPKSHDEVHLLDIYSNKIIRKISLGYDSQRSVDEVSLSHDENFLLIRMGEWPDILYRLLDIQKKSEIKLPPSIVRAQFTSDGKNLVYVTSEPGLKIFDLSTRKSRNFAVSVNPTSLFVSSTDMKASFCESQDDSKEETYRLQCYILDLNTGAIVFKFILPGSAWVGKGTTLSDDSSLVAGTARNRSLATFIQVLNPHTGKEIFNLPRGPWAPHFWFSPDASLLAVCDKDKAHSFNSFDQLYDLTTGNSILDFKFCVDVSFSPNKIHIVTASGLMNDNRARIYNIKKAKVIQTIEHNDNVENVGFSPDGNLVYSRSGAGLKITEVIY